MDTNETKIFTAALIAAAVVALIITYFILTVIRNQRRHLQLQQQYLLTEITTFEKERKRIVSDLHDELGPLLSAVKLQVSGIETTQKDDIELIHKAGRNLDTIVNRIRGICNELMPQVLIRKGLIAAIEEFISDIGTHSSVKIEFTCTGVSTQANSEIHIYRIIQEMLNNSIRHSGADKITISLFSEKNKLILIVADNGKGFDAGKISRESNGLGLKNILSRTEVLKGELFIDTKPGKGAKFTIEIPNRNGSQDTGGNSR